MDFTFIRPQDAIAALTAYMIDHGAGLPEAARSKVQEAMAAMSPVDTIVQCGEALYAARADVDTAGKELGAQLVEFASRFGWHGLNVDARGMRMVAALRRDAGETAPETAPWPDPESDPMVGTPAFQPPPPLPPGHPVPPPL